MLWRISHIRYIKILTWHQGFLLNIWRKFYTFSWKASVYARMWNIEHELSGITVLKIGHLGQMKPVGKHQTNKSIVSRLPAQQTLTMG